LPSDSTEKRNNDGLIIEKAGFKFVYPIYENGKNENRNIMSCLRFASEHVRAYLSLDPIHKPADQRLNRIKDLGINQFYFQLSTTNSVEPGYIEKDGTKYILIKFNDFPNCDFKTTMDLDNWVVREMIKKRKGTEQLTFRTPSTQNSNGTLKAQ
jgi:hypothetical protein